jgi:tRNA-splicing ligase RtcB
LRELTMKGKDIELLGVPKGKAVQLAQKKIGGFLRTGKSIADFQEVLREIAAGPKTWRDDAMFGDLAKLCSQRPSFEERANPAPWRQWGKDLDAGAVVQMENACRLPVSEAGALMADAHLGYGLPIGGVLATVGAVIPYAVGMDIACRMKLSVFDMPVESLETEHERLCGILERETSFGVGAGFRKPHDHEVMSEDWGITQITRRVKEKAHHQLGSSGSGNHFVEFGVLTVEKDALDLKAGTYLSVLSHSGSRGAGSNVATHYSKLAMQLHPELPKELQHLSWLSLDSEEGQEYWAAMQLMGRYSAANHYLIHRKVTRALGAPVLLQVENHHNFAWRETHFGKEVIVHRKGATPAGAGDLGVIPGSMATPGYVVRGRGSREAMDSASHGAGRVMSRKKAKQVLSQSELQEQLRDAGVHLLSAGLDEAPGAYKDIDAVMGYQHDLVEILARFDPRIVKMAS